MRRKRGSSLHPDALLGIALGVFILILTAFLAAYVSSMTHQTIDRACSQEAILCPDGTSVGRSGPECQFDRCPIPDFSGHPGIVDAPLEVPTPAPMKKGFPKNPKSLCTQEMRTCPDGSFVGRTGPNCNFAPCPTNSIDGGPDSR